MWKTSAIWAAGYEPMARLSNQDWQSQQCVWKTTRCMEEQTHQPKGQSDTMYESLQITLHCTTLYSAELWPLTIPQKKKLDAAHHKFQQRTLGYYVEGQSAQ